ncbi:MAG: hypothetical protein RR729_12695, partial [Comamonas sp.]
QVQHFVDGFHGVPPCLWSPALHIPRLTCLHNIGAKTAVTSEIIVKKTIAACFSNSGASASFHN